MAQITQDRLKAYGALAGSIAGGIFVVYTALVDLNMAQDPYARPGAFTDRDGDILREADAELQRQIDRIRSEHERFKEDIKELRLYTVEVRDYIESHETWGKDLARSDAEWKGKINSEHMRFMEDIRSIEERLDRMDYRRPYMDIR